MQNEPIKRHKARAVMERGQQERIEAQAQEIVVLNFRILELKEALLGMLTTYAPQADESAATGGEASLHSSVRDAREALK